MDKEREKFAKWLADKITIKENLKFILDNEKNPKHLERALIMVEVLPENWRRYNQKVRRKNVSRKLAGLEQPEDIFKSQGQVKFYVAEQPIFYDKNCLWWVWDKEKFKWEISDEVDILNHIEKLTGEDIITPKNRTLILNSLKQECRKTIPKDIKNSWVQFGKEIIDIETDESFEATPNYFVTNPIPHDLGKSEDTPEIDKLFVDWVGEEVKLELYETLAFCCVPEYFIHRIICLIGSGANGKSTFLNILKKFIGAENTTSSNLAMIIKSRFEGTKLYKKLGCFFGETNFEIIKSTGFLKSATGEDTLRGEFKGKNPFDFVNYAKWFIATNSLPMTQDRTDGYYRRWKIIDFPNRFKKEKNVISKISEEEYKNLTLKCLNIMKRLYKEREFTNEGDFEERRKRYEDKSNPIMLFINEHYEKDVNGIIIFSDFCDFLILFLKERHLRELNPKEISIQLRQEGYDVKKTTKNNVTKTRIFGLKNKTTHKNTSNTQNPLRYTLVHTREDLSNIQGIKGIKGILTHKINKKPIKPQDFSKK